MSIHTAFQRIKDREYFAIDLPSSSSTKTLLTGTNAHLAWERENPREETEAFAIGAYTHALLLDPESIAANFIAIDKIDRRTKEGKAEWESIQKRAALNGSRIINREQIDLATAMADAVQAHDYAKRILSMCSMREVAMFGEIDGMACKGKLDAVFVDGSNVMIVDIKTTQSASESGFSSSAAQYGYAHQAAFYRLLCEANGLHMDEFLFIAVEKNAPHLTAVYRIDETAVEIAARKIPELVRRWYAVKAGDRYGYHEGIKTLRLPRWWMLNETETSV